MDELRKKMAALVAACRALVDAAEKENRALSTEEREKYDGDMAEVRELKSRIALMEEQDGLKRELAQPTRAAQKPDDPTQIGMDGSEVRNYSLVRAINAAASGDWRGAELEQEASEEIAKRLGKSPQGFFVPNEVQKRDLNVTTAADGGNLVATDLMSGSFIDMLRNRMVVQNAGATVLSGLVGNVAIPRQTGGATAYWVAESAAPTESKQAVDQVAMSPKTVGAFTDISRKLLAQSSIDVENFVRSDLATVLALGIDVAALHGTAANDQPRGIAATSGIGSVEGGTNGDAPTWADIVGLETAVAIDNADIGKLAYITNAKVRGKMKVTPKVASTDSVMLWDNNSSPVNGYNAFVSNQVSSVLEKGSSGAICSAIFFGNWADLIIGMWGVLDILVDPYTGGTAGTVRVVALQDVDIAVRHAESFAAMLDCLTT